jgi:predicted nucleic acid-binding protein
MPKLVFVDAGVLIAAARGIGEVAQRAMAELDDPDHEFASSQFVKLEILPKPLYYRKRAEAEFYRAFFDSVTVWATPSERLIQDAFDEAAKVGLSALDALHVAAAASVAAAEFITSEKATTPIHRTGLVPVRSILPGPGPARHGDLPLG